MNPLFGQIINIVFLVIIGALALLLALASYIYIRYGRTPSITITSSLMVMGIFLLAAIIAFNSLQQVISLYA
jgi:hypothetical protein